MSDMNTKDFLIGSLIGGIVGASAALLLAPKSGKELRSDINETAQAAKEKTSTITNTAYEKSNEFAAIAKDKSSQFAKTVSEQSNQVLEKVKKASLNLKATADELEEAAIEAAAGQSDAIVSEDGNTDGADEAGTASEEAEPKEITTSTL